MLAALTTLAQDYNYTYTAPTALSSDHSGVSAGLVIVLLIISLVLGIATIAGMWKVFTKAGKPGWAAIVPIYNLYILLQIVGRPTWWLLLLLLSFIPFVGSIAVLVVMIIVSNDLSKSFGKGVGMTVAQVLVPFVAYPILGFGSAKYGGPSVPPQNGNGDHHKPTASAGDTPPPATPAV